MSHAINAIALCSLLGVTCACGPAPDFQHAVQTAVRATVSAQNRPAAVASPAARVVAVGPSPSAVAPSPAPVSPTGVPSPPAATPEVAAASTASPASPNPTSAPPTPPRAARPVASPSAPPVTAADSKLADQISAVLEKLPMPRTAMFQSLVHPVRADVDAQAEVTSASTIKLPLMITVFHEVAMGKLKPTQSFTVTAGDVVGGAGVLQAQVGRSLTLTELLETTLTHSDNTGGNMLLDAVGGLAVVDATMADLGFQHTHVRRMLMDEEAQAKGLENTTSAADLAVMLTRIQRMDLISREASAEMLRILELRGAVTDPSLDFLGRHLVPRPIIAHLNGTLLHVLNDAGIVDLQDQPFIFVALLHDQTNDAAAEEAIARASADVLALVHAAAKAP